MAETNDRPRSYKCLWGLAIPLDQYLSYTVTNAWHTQFGIF